jgi:ABC-type polysaccharide/polyol phosphate export permease
MTLFKDKYSTQLKMPEFLQTASIWRHLARRDIKSRYARTLLGPWWSASSLLITVIGITLSTTLLSGRSASLEAPRIAYAMAVWFLISSILIEAASTFESDRTLLLNSTFTEKTMIARLIWRNLLVFLHNWVVVFFVLVLARGSVSSIARGLLSLVVSGSLIAIALFFPTLYIARFGLRFRDSQIFIVSATQMGFFITPIFWDPPRNGALRLVFEINPFGWLIFTGKQFFQTGSIHSDLIGRIFIFCFMSLIVGIMINQRTLSIKKYL